MSFLLKTIPELGDAGRMLKLVFFPVCIPTPVNEIFSEIVF